MRVTTILFALMIVQCYGEKCSVYDEKGNLLENVPHNIESFRRDVKPGNLLPGEINFENMRPLSVIAGNCDVAVDLHENRMRFKLKRKFDNADICEFKVSFEADPTCPATTPKEFIIRYYIKDDEEFRAFLHDNYSFQATFPLRKGEKVSDADIEVRSLGFSTRIELEEDFDGLEIVPVGSTLDGISRFEVKATKLLYLLEDVNLTMNAKDDGLISKARLTIRLNENSILPQPVFEKSFYVVRLKASNLESITDVYPAGIIRLKEAYSRVNFDLRPLNENGMEFSLTNESAQTVGVRLVKASEKNLFFRDAVLQLRARISDQFGRESEGVTTLLVETEESQCELAQLYCYDPNNTQHLTAAVIALSVAVFILLLVIIFMYFKYVCVKKPEPPAPCKKCSAPAPVKTRRPTPRKISEYPYPLDVMPPPLETLTEAETEEGDVKPLEIKVTIPKDEIHPIPSTSGVKTRKRSMTFRDSDEEARQYREESSGEGEAKVHQAERKVSSESQRRTSIEEERRRRKSSVKMYRCLT